MSERPDRQPERPEARASADRDPLATARQPVVTATGILLGFLLNFAGQWVRSDSPLPDWAAGLVAVLTGTGVVCLAAVLHRTLRRDYPVDDADAFYATTLRVLIAGVCLAFLGVFIDMAANFWDV